MIDKSSTYGIARASAKDAGGTLKNTLFASISAIFLRFLEAADAPEKPGTNRD